MHAVAREHADAEGEGLVVARELRRAVLRAGALALGDLEPQVGVREVRQAARGLVNALLDERRDGIDEVDARSVSCQNGSTRTVSPAATSPRSSSSTMRQLPAAIEERMPEPCGPVVRASQRPLLPLQDAALELAAALPLAHRLDRRRLGGVGKEAPPAGQLEDRRTQEEHEREHRGDRIARQAEEVRRLIRPNASGRPGCIATCQKSIAPISPSTSFTRS